MLRPSKKLALALEAVVDVAYHGGAEPVQSQDIARRLVLPRRYLEQVLQQLVRAGVLKGVRGPKGGYRLARERFPKMPLFPGHPTFEVVSYRTPQGIRAAGDQQRPSAAGATPP